MTSAELFCAVVDANQVLGRDGSFNATPALSVETAIIVARDRWTDVDTQQHGEQYRDIIFKWAEEIAESRAGARAHRPYDENELCQYCTKLVHEHSFDQIQECRIKSRSQKLGRYVGQLEEKCQELAPMSFEAWRKAGYMRRTSKPNRNVS